MICPKCGKWNRESFPVCFSCGEALKQTDPALKPQRPKPQKLDDAPVRIVYDEYGEEKTLVDRKTRLAQEMQDLHERKIQGEQRQEELRRQAARQGYAPTGTGVTSSSRRSQVFAEDEAFSGSGDLLKDKHVDYDGYSAAPDYAYAADEISTTPQGKRPRGAMNIPLPGKKSGRTRMFGLRRWLPYFFAFFLMLTAGYALYRFVYLPSLSPKETSQEELVQISASILDDMSAHTIRIPAPEGSQIYIKELRRSFLVTGGYATFQVQDYIWYELDETEIPESMDVSLTPFIRTGTGEQVQMPSIDYTIQIPLSPLTLIKPDVNFMEASTPIYNIQFHVMQNSTVYINGEDYSSYVNTQDGYISYNAPIAPIGENKIHIAVRSQYYRQNQTEIIIYRAVQDIPLDLSSTLEDRSTKPSMTISATTRAGAQITILSPYNSFNDSQLASSGVFSFDAVFSRIGNNTVTIRADYPGRTPTVVEYDVYYLPDPDHYTPKAWGLDEKYGYGDLLANLPTRVRNTQIYVMTGPVVRIVSTKPQLVIFDCADGRTSAPLEVMVENQTKTPWTVGQRYRIFGDTVGSYGGIPRLTARYTYKPAAPKTN